jgi:hypothetical protein
MTLALTSPFESTGIPLAVHWKNTATEGDKREVQFGLHVAPEGVTIEGERNLVNLDIAVVALRSKTGAAADTVSQTLEGPTSADTLTKLHADGLTYNNTLRLPAGQYTVRFVVRDNPSGKVGSVTAPLTVN